MPGIFRNSGWFFPSVICLSLATGNVHGQEAAPPPWSDLLKNEFVVVGRYASHKNGVMSLQVVEVLRGKACKPGDILPVKFTQKFGFKFTFVENGQFAQRILVANDDDMKWPQLVLVEEKDGQLHETVLTAPRALHTYFFDREAELVLDRPDQLQPDRRRGWKQALEGKPVDLSFQILYDLESETSRKAIRELARTRDKEAIAGLIEAMTQEPSSPRVYLGRQVAKRVLLSLGDKDGDVYDPVRKTLKPNTAVGTTAVFAELGPRLDRKRALADFKELFKQGQAPMSGISIAELCCALTELESEEGLDLMFEWMHSGNIIGIYAYGALQRVCFDRLGPYPNGAQILQRQSEDMVQRAKMQDLALPRMKKLLKNQALPVNVYQSAMMWPNFSFVVEEPPNGAQIWPLNNGLGFNANRCPSRNGFPKWEQVVLEAQNDVEPVLKADLIEGRKLLKDRLARAPQPGPNGPFDLLVLQSLAHRYGDMDMVKKFKKPGDPIVRVRGNDTSKANQGVPLSDFKPAFEDTLKLSPDYRVRLRALFPEHAGLFFRELETLIVSEDKEQREFAISQLEEMFFWNFDIDPDQYAFACKRKLEKIKPLLDRLSRSSDILEMRGMLLQHFGVKLEGPPGTKWLPAIEAAALRWNTVVHLNAMCVLGMIEEAPEIMSLVNNAPSIREKVLQAHLKKLRAKSGAAARTAKELESLWKDLDHGRADPPGSPAVSCCR
jgi:hypothetical protein